MSRVPVDTTLLAVALAVGILAIATATTVAARHEPPARRHPRLPRGLAPLVPWVGSVVTVALLLRGSIPAAVLVGLATLAHAVAVRMGASRRR